MVERFVIPYPNNPAGRSRWNKTYGLNAYYSMGKMIMDGMKGRLIQDDSRRWVKGVAHYFHDCDHILVEVKEI